MRGLTPKFGAYAALSALGLIAALVVRRPELAVLAAPFALTLALGVVLARRPDVRISAELERERAIEDDEVELRLDVYARTGAGRLELRVDLPAELEVADGSNPIALSLERDEERELRLRLRCARWGGWTAGPIHLRYRDSLGFVLWEESRD